MVSYDHSKLMDYCESHADELIAFAEVILDVNSCRLLRFIAVEIANTDEVGWRKVWTEPKPVDDIVRSVYGKKCALDKRRPQLMKVISDAAYNHVLHGITMPDGKLSLALEPFFPSWRKLNGALCVLYPASILRLWNSFGQGDCPFPRVSTEGIVKKKFECVHPSLKLNLPEGARSAASIIALLTRTDQFSCIDKLRMKADGVPRPLLFKGVVGASADEAEIIPVDTFFKKPEPDRKVVIASRDRYEWRNVIEATVDCDLRPALSYSEMVEYVSREIRRRKNLPFDYPFYVNASISGRLKEVMASFTDKKALWPYCRWLAETLDKSKLPNYKMTPSKMSSWFDIVEYAAKGYKEFSSSGFDPGTLMRPSNSVYSHLSKIWRTENPVRRFVYSSCIYGIPVTCAYIAMCHLQKKEGIPTADPYESDVGLAKIRMMDRNKLSYTIMRKATEKYMSGHVDMIKYETDGASALGFTPSSVPCEKWPAGLYDFILTMSSLLSVGVGNNA